MVGTADTLVQLPLYYSELDGIVVSKSVFTSVGRVSGKATCVLPTRIVPWQGSSVISASGT